MRKPRLKQPLFSDPSQAAAQKEPGLADFIRAYDCIWNLVHRPDDIELSNRLYNAHANLERLGHLIEAFCGTEPFEIDPNQMGFPEEILKPSQPALLDIEPLPLGLTQLK